jgi:hypothetical protein
VINILSKFYYRLIAFCLLFFLLSPITILYLAIENKPYVDRKVTILPEHIERIKYLIDTHRDEAYSGKIAIAWIPPEDFDMAINYLAHLFANGRAQTALNDGEALLRLTYPLPGNVLSGYLNFETTFTETNHLPLPQSIRIGNFLIPEFLTSLFVKHGLRWLQNNHLKFHAGLEALQHIKISQEGIRILYRWEEGLFEKTSDMTAGMSIMSKQEQERVFRYHLMLANNQSVKNRTTIPLSELLASAMMLASQHSINGNPLEENRAAILATTLHVLNQPLKLLFPEASNLSEPIRIKVTLDGREDFAKHFMVSAAIAAYADTLLADAIGLYKEIEDSRSGSGFSFNDIAANRAGTRFAEQAIANRTSALKLQKLISSELNDTDLMPDWADLPEHMPESVFIARFGSIDTPRYQQMMKIIDQRVAALRILH